MIRTQVRAKPEVMNVYDRESSVYNLRRFSNKGGRYIDQVEKRLLSSVGQGPALLEVGVATGRFIGFVKKRGWSYTGIDISRNMLKYATRFDGELIQADGEAPPIRDSSYDAIFCLHTFHFLPHPYEALREFHRLLRPGGRLLLIFEMDTWLRRLGLRLLSPRSNQFYYTTSEVAGMAVQSGFELIGEGPVLNLPMEAYRKLPMSLLQRGIDLSGRWPRLFATLGFVAASRSGQKG